MERVSKPAAPPEVADEPDRSAGNYELLDSTSDWFWPGLLGSRDNPATPLSRTIDPADYAADPRAATTVAALSALRSKVAQVRGERRVKAASSAWHAEPWISHLCKRFVDPIGGISITDDDILVVSLEVSKGCGYDGEDVLRTERCIRECGQGSQGAVDLSQSQSRRARHTVGPLAQPLSARDGALLGTRGWFQVVSRPNGRTGQRSAVGKPVSVRLDYPVTGSNAARGFQRDDLADFHGSKSRRSWRRCPQWDKPVESCPVPCNWRIATFAVGSVTFGAGRSWGGTLQFATHANACTDQRRASAPSRAGFLIWRAAGLHRRQRCEPVRAADAPPATEPLSVAAGRAPERRCARPTRGLSRPRCRRVRARARYPARSRSSSDPTAACP